MAWFHAVSCFCITVFTCYVRLIHLQPIQHNKEAETCYGDALTARLKVTALQNTLETAELRLQEAILQYEELFGKYIDLMKLVGSLIREKGIDTENICKRMPSVITSHPKECRLYYNCSSYHRVYWYDPMFGNWTYLHECRYPELFSEKTLRCENYTTVECGSRRESKWACDYYFPRCKFSHCKPCRYEYPKCSDKKDGLWPPDDRLFTTYVICKNGRPQMTGSCEEDSVWFESSYPYNNKCTSIYEIPESAGGYLPSCVGKSDGKYRFDKKPCVGYLQCKRGNATVHKCPPQTLFDAQSQACKSNYDCRN